MVRMPSCCIRLQASRERIPNSTGLPGGVCGGALEGLAGRSQRTAERASPPGPCTRVAWTAPPAKQLSPRGTLLSSQARSLAKNTLLRASSHLKKPSKAEPSAQNLVEAGTAATSPAPPRTHHERPERRRQAEDPHKPSPAQAPPRGAGGTEPNRGPPASSRRPGPTRVKPHSLSHGSLSVERGQEHQPTS